MAQGFVDEPLSSPAPPPPLAGSGYVDEPVPDFKVRVEAQDPNTAGTFVSHLGAQINPITMVKTLGAALTDIPGAVKSIGAAQGALFDKAKASYDQGDYLTAARHFVNYLIPLVGPGLDKSSDLFQAGKWAAGAGDAIGLGLAMFGPSALSNVAAARYPLAAAAPATKAMNTATGATQTPVNPAVTFAQQRGIPLDAATVSDNLAVKGTQAIADRSLGGSLIATPAKAAQATAMTRVGGELADQANAAAVTPEQAGTGLRDALTAKMAGHTQDANTAYDTLRELEQQPTNRLTMPPDPAPVDGLSDDLRGQVRRIVHELDAAPYTKQLLEPSGVGGSLQAVEGTGGAGAKVFDDIVQRAGSGATRGLVQQQLEKYLAGGPETNITKAALDVATARSQSRGGYAVSLPELPPSAMDVPTTLEASRPSGQEMGLPVSLAQVKAFLKPVYDQMMRQMPLTQQQANPGLKALENIVNGPDWAPLSQVDRDLGEIKTVSRNQGGLAKFAAGKLDAAVTQAAQNGGPVVAEALQQGRAATIAKYATSDVLDTLNAEPVKTVRALTATKDSAIQQLRAVTQQVPAQTPAIARAYLEDLLEKPNKVAEWSKLGAQTKQILFPAPGQAAALDNFFDLTNRISKTNVNPSGSGYVVSLAAQGGALGTGLVLSLTNPAVGVGVLASEGAAQIGGAALAKLLRSPAAVNALTRGMTMPNTAPLAVRTAVTLNLVRAAREAGVPLDVPKAADQGPGQ